MRRVCTKLQESLDEACEAVFGFRTMIEGMDTVAKSLADVEANKSRVYFEYTAAKSFQSPLVIVQLEVCRDDPEFQIEGKVTILPATKQAIQMALEDSKICSSVKNTRLNCKIYTSSQNTLFFERMRRFYQAHKLEAKEEKQIGIVLWTMIKQGAEKLVEKDIEKNTRNLGSKSSSSIRGYWGRRTITQTTSTAKSPRWSAARPKWSLLPYLFLKKA